MEFEISFVVLVVFAVLMIGNALKTSRASRKRAAITDSTSERAQRDAA